MDGSRSLRTLLLVSALVATLVAPVGRAQGLGPERAEPSSPVVIEVSDGFHWRDAVVGAVAAIALVTIAVGLTLVVRDGRDEPPPARGSDP